MESWLDDEKKTNKQIQLKKKKNQKEGRCIYWTLTQTEREGEREAPIRARRGKQSEKRKSAGHFAFSFSVQKRVNK